MKLEKLFTFPTNGLFRKDLITFLLQNLLSLTLFGLLFSISHLNFHVEQELKAEVKRLEYYSVLSILLQS